MLSVLLNATSKTVVLENKRFPLTLTLKSADATRKIELSTDGSEYFTPAIDVISTTQQVVIVSAPVYDVKFTGLATDTFLISHSGV